MVGHVWPAYGCVVLLVVNIQLAKQPHTTDELLVGRHGIALAFLPFRLDRRDIVTDDLDLFRILN